MALRKIYCPNCGQATQIDDTKEFCFCLSCGNRISVPKRKVPIESDSISRGHNTDINIIEQPQSSETNLLEKLKEAEFYYKLSKEKKEYSINNDNPTYYLKGQDILVDLSQEYPFDYRIWWELCKPMDFDVVMTGEKSGTITSINDAYFDKALDYAPLDKKMNLINQRDKYSDLKAGMLNEIKAEKEAMIERNRQLAEEEERKKQAEIEEKKLIEIQRLEEENKKLEEERRKIDEINKKKQELEIERKKQELLNKGLISESVQVEKSKNGFWDFQPAFWTELVSGNYSKIDNTYFKFKNNNNLEVIVVFKKISNILYLSSFHIDEKKTVFVDQSIAVHFADKGTVIKYDNKPVIVKDWNSDSDNIQLFVDTKGECIVNNMPLLRDDTYINDIYKKAKKPLISLKKIFD